MVDIWPGICAALHQTAGPEALTLRPRLTLKVASDIVLLQIHIAPVLAYVRCVPAAGPVDAAFPDDDCSSLRDF